MSDVKFFKPHPDRLVRDPVTGHKLDAEGEFINMNHPKRRDFYPRRLKDGDITETRPPAPRAAKAPEPKED